MGGLPQPVSQVVVLSSVLPMLVPGVISGTAAQASRAFIFSSAGGVASPAATAFDDALDGAFDRLTGGGRRHPSAATAQTSPVRSDCGCALRMLVVIDLSGRRRTFRGRASRRRRDRTSWG